VRTDVTEPAARPVLLVCLSDTHGRHPDPAGVPAGDVLIHAGDLTSAGGAAELEAADRWFAALPHAHKLYVPGNMDLGVARDPAAAAELLAHARIVVDREVELEVGGRVLRLWGSPYTPAFVGAFQLAGRAAARAKWRSIPAGLDVLVTHGPPRGVLDRTSRGARVGCPELARAVARARPTLMVFGHVHASFGVADGAGPTAFLNAAQHARLEGRTDVRPLVHELR